MCQTDCSTVVCGKPVPLLFLPTPIADERTCVFDNTLFSAPDSSEGDLDEAVGRLSLGPCPLMFFDPLVLVRNTRGGWGVSPYLHPVRK